MNSRQLKRGENIVGLTQTEIMLVLTIVVLVLLLAGDIDLKASQKRAVLLERLASESRDDVMGIEEQINLAEQITGILDSSAKSSGRRDQSRLTERDVQTVRSIVEESQAKDEELEHLRKALEDKQKTIDRMTAGRDEQKRTAGSGDRHGYTPCWPRVGQGPRKRYHTYDVTYDGGSFRIKQNIDWSRPKVPNLGKDMDRKLSAVLLSYPRETIAKQDFSEFGERVEGVLTEMRGNNRDGWYEPGCSLVVTLNPEAPGSIAAFIRGNVGMWPITRNRR